MSVCSCICLSTYLYTHLPTCISTNLLMYLFTYLSVNPPFHLSPHPPAYHLYTQPPSLSLPIYLPTHLLIWLSNYLPIHSLVHLLIYLPICPQSTFPLIDPPTYLLTLHLTHLPIHLLISLYLFSHPSTYLLINPLIQSPIFSSIHLPTNASVHPYICLPTHLPIIHPLNDSCASIHLPVYPSIISTDIYLSI